MKWLHNYLDRCRRARDWRPVQRFECETIWTDCNNVSAGWTVYIGFENGLGQRRIKLVQKPNWPAKVAGHALSNANAWLYEPRPSGPVRLRAVK